MRPSGDQQRQETLKLSLPLTKTRELADSSMMSIPYADQATWNRLAYPTHHNRPARSRLPNLSLRIFLAATISVVAVLISLSICNSLRGKGQGSGLTRRKLAEGDARIDADELSIVEGCLELEEEMGILQQRAVSSSQGDSSSRVTELVSMLSEAAAAKGSMQEGLYVDNQLHQQFLEGHSGFQPRVGELVRVHGHSLQTAVESRGSMGMVPALDPDSWMDTIPSIGLQPDEQKDDEPLWYGGEVSNSAQAPAAYASNRERLVARRDLLQCGDIRNHPYVHLPVLEDGVVPRYIQAAALFARRPGLVKPHAHLLTLRTLFAKETLNQQDADLLVDSVELLVTSYWFKRRPNRKRAIPILAVEILGHYLMVFDYIVCAFQLLGEYMQLPLWWDKFTASFNTNIPLRSPGPREKQLMRFHVHLAGRLLAALDIYKKGERPPLFEVVTLKSLLFCSPFGRHRLKHPKWEPWRKDGGCP